MLRRRLLILVVATLSLASALTVPAAASLQTSTQRPIVSTVRPTITGAPVYGSILTAHNGSWYPSVTKVSHRWYANGVAIKGAISSKHLLTVADLGKRITVVETAKRFGYAAATRVSMPSSPIARRRLTASATPTVSGSPVVGSKLTAVPGSWSPSPVTYTYQWYRNGVAIIGAISSTYVVTAADSGASITVRQTGSKVGYSSASAVSAPTAVGKGFLFDEPVPMIDGLPVEGSMLNVRPAIWHPSSIALTFQWSRDGVEIPGATGPNHVVTDADRGSDLTVKVTGTAAGYNPVSTTSRTEAVSPESASKVARALQTFHAALGTAGTSPVDIFVGPSDSITEGYGATSVDKRWISVIRDDLRRSFQPLGVPGGMGYLDFWNQGSFRDYPVTTENRIDNWAHGLGAESIDLAGSEQTATVTATLTGLDILYVGSTDGSTGRFHYTVDGGAPQYVDTGSRPVAGGGQVESIRGLESGTHTIRIFGEDAAEAVTIEGAMAYDGDATRGIRLWEGGRSGFTAALFAGDFRGWEQSVGDVNPDLVVMPIGSNDYWVGRSVADTKVYIERIISRLRANVGTNPSIVLVPYYDRSNSNSVPWSDFVQMYYDIAADDPDMAVIDLGPLFGPWVGDDRGGLTIGQDLVHPSTTGHQLIGDSLAAFLAP